jgi:dephospho-CoA kinase
VGGKNYNKLNEITHRHILAEVRRRIDAAKDMGREVVIVDAPLLFESGFDRECNYIIGVISDDETSVKRVTARDNIDQNTARKRLEKQKSNDFLKANCHFIIENNSTVEELLRRAREIYDTIGGKG